MTSPQSIKLSVQRDSVCAADDVGAPHSESVSIKPDSSLAEFLQIIQRMGYLAQISGGRATWIVELDRPVAVMAQQWKSPQFLIDPETRIADCAKLDRPLFFRYRCQANPSVIFNCLKAGDPLPDMYGGEK
jgi:hypothetical protein